MTRRLWGRWWIAVFFTGYHSLARSAESGEVVHLLTPGFVAEELPVKLSNQNNLRFGPDGALYSLGYDGRIWRIRDSGGKGMEDRAEAFWDRASLRVPVGMEWGPDGLYVSSQGKVSRFIDDDRDGKADREEVVVENWEGKDAASGGVDAMGVTLDDAGDVYFGLLTSDYANAYRLRKRSELKPEDLKILERMGIPVEGPPSEMVSLYEPGSRRGTIQRWKRSTKTLETMATGIRVPYALQFNAWGDLFNTDQEGETWMPDGNPLDELNHIVTGRNYGFPPPHPKWLPGMDPDPPVAAFGPQHQSSCGFVFNEEQPARNGRAARGRFGPETWQGEALVAGESRGRIWRVRLARTANGYLSRVFPFARIGMLITDVTISPKGDLYVSCHSGPPDWGTGPSGEGRLFRIRQRDAGAPRPIAGYVLPDLKTVRLKMSTRIDREIEKAAHVASVSVGEYVTAGDEWEYLKPPYAVVKQQDAAPRRELKVRSVRLDTTGRIVDLETDGMALMSPAVIRLAGIRRSGETGPGESAQWELRHCGVAVAWVPVTTAEDWLNRPPDSNSTQWALWSEPSDASRSGRSIWSTPMREPSIALGDRDVEMASNMKDDVTFLAGFRLEHASPAHRIRITGFAPFEVLAGKRRSSVLLEGKHRVELGADSPLDRGVILIAGRPRAGAGAGTVAEGWEILQQSRPNGAWRAVATESYVLPWAPVARISSGTASREESGPVGDWEHGRELFYGKKLQCGTCHQVRGEGAITGPDLSNLIHRDRATILRDIRDPGATMHPDYVTYAVKGNVATWTGFIRPGAAPDQVEIFDGKGGSEMVFRSEIVEMHPTGQSLMPAGLLDGSPERDIADLVTFLRHAPPQESRDVDQAKAVGPKKEAPARKLILVAAKQDHGPGQHAYPIWQSRWVEWLKNLRPGDTVETAWEWPSKEQWAAADVVVFYFWNHRWDAERLGDLDAFQRRGGGSVFLHSAVISDDRPEELAKRIGLAAMPGRTDYRHMPLNLQVADARDAWMNGMPDGLDFLDEPYWPMIGDVTKVKVLAGARVDGGFRPLIWRYRPSGAKGTVMGCILGHYLWTLEDAWFKAMVSKAIEEMSTAPMEKSP